MPPRRDNARNAKARNANSGPQALDRKFWMQSLGTLFRFWLKNFPTITISDFQFKKIWILGQLYLECGTLFVFNFVSNLMCASLRPYWNLATCPYQISVSSHSWNVEVLTYLGGNSVGALTEATHALISGSINTMYSLSVSIYALISL